MSNRNRRYNSSSDFTTPGLANEANTAATRDAVRGDVYGSQTTFQAIVLTQPVPLDSSQIYDLYGVDHRGGASVVPTFQFKGRIVGGDLPSPHEFLPDPCKLDRSVNWQTTLDLIAQHTTFVSEAGYDGATPSVGDMVEIELEAGDVKYNLQYGTFKNIVNSAVIEPGNRDSESCTSMLSIFENLDGNIEPATTIGEIFEGRPAASNMSQDMVVIQGTGIDNPGNHKALPGVSNWLEDLMTVINGLRAAGDEKINLIPHVTNGNRFTDGCPGGEPGTHRDGVAGTTPWTVTITSGYRAPEDQARAMMGLRADHFGFFGYRYDGSDGNEVRFGEWAGNPPALQTRVDFGNGMANFSDLPARFQSAPIAWPPAALNPRATICNNLNIGVRGMCKQGFTWANNAWPKATNLDSFINKTTDPYQYTGAGNSGNGYFEGSPAWGIGWESNGIVNTLRPNPSMYHIWRLYSGANPIDIEEFLKLDFDRSGGTEATIFIEDMVSEGKFFSSHQRGKCIDISLRGDMAPLTHRDFFLDVLYDAGRTTEAYESVRSPGFRIAWERLQLYGAPSAGKSFFENTHLHLTCPDGAFQPLAGQTE